MTRTLQQIQAQESNRQTNGQFGEGKHTDQGDQVLSFVSRQGDRSASMRGQRQAKDPNVGNEPAGESLAFVFPVGTREVFVVEYYRLGNNRSPHFTTSASRWNHIYSDINQAGQAQESLLPPDSPARAFYDKWDQVHLGNLTKAQYTELRNDLESLQEAYPQYQSEITEPGSDCGIPLSLEIVALKDFNAAKKSRTKT